VLSEKKIPFQVTEIDLKNKPEWFLEISPYGLVPVVKHGEVLLYESAVINEYLDEVFPDTPMMADSPAERAEMRIWIDFCNARLHPRQAAILKAEPEAFGEAVQAYEDALAMLESHLERSGRATPFFGRGRFTLVDATYAPLFERTAVLPHLRGYELPGRFPRVRGWIAALAGHAAVRATSTPLAELIANYTHWVPEADRRVA
jgi:glutathione S-transferase